MTQPVAREPFFVFDLGDNRDCPPKDDGADVGDLHKETPPARAFSAQSRRVNPTACDA
jgi:hypothetical protein